MKYMKYEEAALEKEYNRADIQVNQHFSFMLSEVIVVSFQIVA